MTSTPFPKNPVDVVPLSVQEFVFDLSISDAPSLEPSLEIICRRFVDDTNRALVWMIRFRALNAWRARADMADWLNTRSGSSNEACELAASFGLNDRWEFDTQDFCSAIDKLVSRRTGTNRGFLVRWREPRNDES
jgi:hypothetical protein